MPPLGPHGTGRFDVYRIPPIRRRDKATPPTSCGVCIEETPDPMSSKKTTRTETQEVYDVSTPLLDQFIREARKRLRFPRYYKKALNW